MCVCQRICHLLTHTAGKTIESEITRAATVAVVKALRKAVKRVTQTAGTGKEGARPVGNKLSKKRDQLVAAVTRRHHKP